MSSENMHYSTVRVQDSTRLIVEDSIMLVIEPQISLNLKSVPVGLTMKSPDATGSSNGAHPARLYLDVSEEVAGWAHQIDIRSDFERGKF